MRAEGYALIRVFVGLLQDIPWNENDLLAHKKN
jgi:hypothetical protein